jgi:CMP/dCMP kinase
LNRRAPLIVAIDGPAGVGKSSAARRLAERLGIPYLNTGAMYRALALAALDHGIDPGDREGVERLAGEVDIRLAPGEGADIEVLLDGRPVGERIKSPEVSEATSTIATYPAVRRQMVALQQEGGRALGGVVEGRDIGTRVFPDADFKFFFDARPEVRAGRRLAELLPRRPELTLEEVLDDLARRDHRDANRADSPLTRDATYRVVDTSDRGLEEIVAELEEVVRGGD